MKTVFHWPHFLGQLWR